MSRITRRSLLKSATVATSISAMGASHSIAPTAHPQRVIFIYTSGGAPRNTWQKPCGAALQDGLIGTQPLAPWIPRCAFFKRTTTMNHGFFSGTVASLCSTPFAENANSLDTVMAAALSNQRSVPHLKLLAQGQDFHNGEDSTPTIVDGVHQTLDEYHSRPLELYTDLFGERAPQRHFPAFDSSDYQDRFDWLADRQIELTTLALQSNLTNVTTLMLGDADGNIDSPGLATIESGRTWRSIPVQNASVAEMCEFRNYISSKIAYLLKLLATTADSNGMPLLDTTLIYNFTNMGEPVNYTEDGGCYLLAGAAPFIHYDAVLPASLNNYWIMNTLTELFGLPDAAPRIDHPIIEQLI